MRNNMFLFFATLLFVACQAPPSNPQQAECEAVPPRETVQPAAPLVEKNFSDFSPEIEGETGPFRAEVTRVANEDGVSTFAVLLKSDSPATPPRFRVWWKVPVTDVAGQWTTRSLRGHYIRPNWSNGGAVDSRAPSNAPVFTLFGEQDENRLTFAVADGLNKVTLKAAVVEEDAMMECEVVFFDEPHPPVTQYETELRIDLRTVDYSESLRDVSDWWAAMEGSEPAVAPEHASLPMYSTWYAFHQNLVPNEVVAECAAAKKLGYEAVIVDDGWQTTDSGRGYAYTGDWRPERIPDMKGFVDRIHGLGMKFILWYSVPFVGEKSNNAARFEGMYLEHQKGRWSSTYVLDPRYPEVREFIISTYESAMKEWGLDGFKLDFIDNFYPREDTVLTAEDGRDYASVNRATDRLMTDIKERLTQLNPDVLIEFRQSYIGPLMRKYGNMFRAGDCPSAYIANRIRTTDLRLLSGDTPVHADMLMWHKNEPTESAALQILNVLFSVPQLSVRLDTISDDHKAMVAFWTKYWTENRGVLMDGTFRAHRPNHNYPLISSHNKNKTIVGVYDHTVVPIEHKTPGIDIVNATLGNSVVIKTHADLGEVKATTFDCKGNKVTETKRALPKGIHEFQVPRSGLLTLQ